MLVTVTTTDNSSPTVCITPEPIAFVDGKAKMEHALAMVLVNDRACKGRFEMQPIEPEPIINIETKRPKRRGSKGGAA